MYNSSLRHSTLQFGSKSVISAIDLAAMALKKYISSFI